MLRPAGVAVLIIITIHTSVVIAMMIGQEILIVTLSIQQRTVNLRV